MKHTPFIFECILEDGPGYRALLGYPVIFDYKIQLSRELCFGLRGRPVPYPIIPDALVGKCGIAALGYADDHWHFKVGVNDDVDAVFFRLAQP